MQNLCLNENNILTILGAKKVLSCTQTQAVVETEKRKIIITGNSIEVRKLNLENGEVCLFGFFTNIKLVDSQEKKPLLKRIFK